MYTSRRDPGTSLITGLRRAGVVMVLGALSAHAASPDGAGVSDSQGAAPPTRQAPDHRGWFDAALGVARLGQQVSGSSTTYGNDSSFSIEGGWHLNTHWLLGANLGGISIQSTCADTPFYTCSPSERQRGKGIEHLFAVAEYHPADRHGWLLHAGLGFAQSWATISDANKRGLAGDLGVGYGWAFRNTGQLGVRLDMEWGHLSGSAGIPGLNYTAPQLAVFWAFD